MLFQSQYFIIFFIFVFSIHWILPKKRNRHFLLLLSSYVFYMFWNIKLVFLLIFSSLLDFYIGNRIYKKRSFHLVFFSVAMNLSILGYFKYYNFFIESLHALLSQVFNYDSSFSTLNIILPLGISFYTFQSMSYTIDIYRRKYRPYDSLMNFALYVSFFPQLIAGPIVRADYFKKQIDRKVNLSFKLINTGVSLFIIGCFKKIVLADQAAVFSNEFFSNPSSYTFFISIVGVMAFSFQIYFDFSGYTDMARGLGYLLGFRLPENFLHPYGALGIKDFWRRWHLSLSSWLRDYLYIPLGGSRISASRTKINLLITMLLGGLWHGASWNFVIWGGIHGLLLSLENYITNVFNFNNFSKVANLSFKVFTFFVVCFTWIFFRAETFSDSIVILKSFTVININDFFHQLYFFGIRNWIFGFILPFSIIIIGAFKPVNKTFKSYEVYGLFVILVLLLTIFLVGGGGNEFIYFQF